MKKDGLFGSLVKAIVEDEKQKYADKEPDLFFQQKKQMWYFLMNQIDGEETADGEETFEGKEAGEQPENK